MDIYYLKINVVFSLKILNLDNFILENIYFGKGDKTLEKKNHKQQAIMKSKVVIF